MKKQRETFRGSTENIGMGDSMGDIRSSSGWSDTEPFAGVSVRYQGKTGLGKGKNLREWLGEDGYTTEWRRDYVRG